MDRNPYEPPREETPPPRPAKTMELVVLWTVRGGGFVFAAMLPVGAYLLFYGPPVESSGAGTFVIVGALGLGMTAYVEYCFRKNASRDPPDART